MSSFDNPFATPSELRDPARRLRGRLLAPVTLWTSGTPRARTGLTISSVLVAEGAPSSIVGLVNPTSDLWELLQDTRAFVVHVLASDQRLLAERFAGLRPAPGGLFEGEVVEQSSWGPELTAISTRARCCFADAAEAGYASLVRGTIENLEIGDDVGPLAYFQGRFRRLAPDRPG